MTLFVFSAVLLSSFLQASWNFATKKSSANKVSLLVVGWFLLGLIMLPVVFYFHPPSTFQSNWVFFCLASGFIHAFYVCLLGWGYSIGEISVVYPIARGLGIAGTSVLSLLLGLQSISIFGGAGIASIVFGTLLIGYKEVPAPEKRMAFGAAVLIAMTVSCYSVVDSIGARQTPTLILLAGMNIFAPLFAMPFLHFKNQLKVREILENHKTDCAFVAIGGTIAYTIILWAYQHAATAYVAALREFSVVIATLLGVFILKEPLYNKKKIAIALILLGIVLIRAA